MTEPTDRDSAPNEMDDMDEMDETEQKLAEKAEEMLKRLLGKRLLRPEHPVGLVAEMGKTKSVVSTATQEWIADKVEYAWMMPLLAHKTNDEGQLILDEEAVPELRQRQPDWTRQKALTRYAVKIVHRKFPPLLLCVTEPWAHDLDAPEWDEEGRATKDSLDTIPLDSEGVIVQAVLKGSTKLFALDGQHRLMAANGIVELDDSGQLTLWKKDRTYKETISKETLLDQWKVGPDALLTARRERVGIELIPAVLKDETYEEARSRVRTIFVHVNRMARRLTPGQHAMLDEDDGFTLVARKIATTHALFHWGDIKEPKINWNTNSLPPRSAWLTTFQTIVEMAKEYLGPQYPEWKAGVDEVPERSDESEIEEGVLKLGQFMDMVSGLPCFTDLRSGMTTPAALRAFPGELGDQTPKPGEHMGHLLLRPLGQVLLATAVGTYVCDPLESSGNTEEELGMKLKDIGRKLAYHDSKGGFLAASPESVWWGVTYDHLGKGRMKLTGKSLGAGLLLHLLGGQSSDQAQGLLATFRAERVIDPPADPPTWRNWDGETVTNAEAVQLPPLL